MNNTLHDLLYSIPESVEYTEFPEELDQNDITIERFNELVKVMENNSSSYIQYRAALLLCSWGDKRGLEHIKQLFNYDISDDELDSIYHIRETGRKVLDAVFFYRANRLDLGRDIDPDIKNDIYPVVVNMIKIAGKFNINLKSFFDSIGYNFDEYLPYIKDYFFEIIDSKYSYWEVYDVIVFFLRRDPKFIKSELERRKLSLDKFDL